MIDPTLSVVRPWDTDPNSTATGFIENNPECLQTYQNKELEKLRLLNIDHSEVYLAEHPQVEALLRILIGSLAINRPADPRHFIRGILSQENLETDVAKIVALQLDTNSEHIMKYWTKFPFWEDKTKDLGKPYYNSSSWPRARPDRPGEKTHDQLEYGGSHQLKAPGLFYPTELMAIKKPTKMSEYFEDMSQCPMDHAIFDRFFEIFRSSDEDANCSSAGSNEDYCPNDERSESDPQIPSAKDITCDELKFDDILKDIDTLLIRSHNDLIKLKEGLINKQVDEEEKQEEADDESNSLYGDSEYETRLNLIAKKTSESEEFDIFQRGIEDKQERDDAFSMIWISALRDTVGNVKFPSQKIINPSSSKDVTLTYINE